MKKLIIISSVLFISIFLFAEINAQVYEYKSKGFKIQIGSIDRKNRMDFLVSEKWQKCIIQLEQHNNEHLYGVELTIGKMVKIDCNGGGIAGYFRKDTINDDIPCFIFEQKPVYTTNRGCIEPPEYIFKTISQIIEYNSNQPLIVHFPREFELKHTIVKLKTY